MVSRKVELVFVPAFGASHIIPTVELGKSLIERDDRFSITVIVPTAPLLPTPTAYIESVTNSIARIPFIILPQADLPPPGTQHSLSSVSICIHNHRPFVKKAITKLISESKPTDSIGLVVDMFSTTMIDVANELSIPSYLYITSGAAFLGLMLQLPTLDLEIKTEFQDYSSELIISSFVNPVPTLALPSILLDKKSDSYTWFLSHASRFRETKGIIVNSTAVLESHPTDVFNRLTDSIPRVYLVGPLLDIQGKKEKSSVVSEQTRIMKWLDDQPDSSVIFLCFGSQGSLSAVQVNEIAKGLEQSGQRFLWSLRRPPTATFEPPSDYTNLEEILPNGFLERIHGKGLVCGWAPQIEVLAHKATGGFVSHCGWNSILESLWYGVPIVTWPLDAEQKLNAFELVKELGLGVEIKECYCKRKEGDDLVLVEDIEKTVRYVIKGEEEVRRKVKEMKEKCRNALMDGGSSWLDLGCLVNDLIHQIAET
ncbi:Udp-glycosyltransferase 71k2 [Thalictrum thalictroides]|uniref:Glycosyltransferase n=1 Tax=Thalictrum thalictroides TaxID=46969 RepID=A0A7J6X2Q4_THATH|nr:Udp-glycosyltransferase 71k2 [Thalictrum thalictroides]